jgi:hypothetical protein
MDIYHWTCPYCNRDITLTEHNISNNTHYFSKDNKDGQLALSTTVLVCPK